MNEILKTMTAHQSVRHYTGQPLTAEQVTQIKQAVRQTSSTCFFQMVSVLRLTARPALAKMAELAGGQAHVAACAEFWLFLLDLTLLRRTTRLPQPVPFKMLQSAVTDAALCCQNALTAAEALGLGGVIIGGFRERSAAVADLCRLPATVVPSVGLCLGVPDERYREAQKPRLPEQWLFHENTYADRLDAPALAAYNAAYAAYNRTRHDHQSERDWTATVTARLPQPGAAPSTLGAFYRRCGFDLS